MATGQGTATINFGTTGLNETSIAVTGQATISATSKVEAFIMADNISANRTASDHRYFNIMAGLTCGTPTAGTGFTIYGTSLQKLTGQYLINWVWAD
jgi:hypothetical protein